MALTFVIHEATRTGAPRVGGLIARELARGEDLRLIVMKDGPLTPWFAEMLGPDRVTVCRGEPFHFLQPFDQRLRLAQDLLDGDPSDLVYVNSLAASVFALASALGKRKTILHVHEKSAEMVNLLANDITKLDVMRVADALVLAAEDIRDDLGKVFGAAPAEIEDFGVAVDVEAIRRDAQAPFEPPRNAFGQGLAPGARAIVGMCGHASARKGADVFLGLAAAAPQCDFLWVGGWRPEETPDNVAFEEFAKRPPPNLYLAGVVENPYPLMGMMDLFFLSSREDPNPLVLGEALALGRPILAFSQATAISDRLGRYAMMAYGKPNVADAARLLAATPVEALRGAAFRGAGEAYVADYDLREKVARLTRLIARVRGVEPPPAETVRLDAPEGVQRPLVGGGLELSFS